ncbi:MAG TPA: hypothetical protein VJB59_00415 [Bdellovibrionota bacterium]|nr:hypothetical protein [Bdellovibrionota bacterium]
MSHVIRKNELGVNLIEVMVAAAVIAIVMLGFTQMITYQQRETRALSEKLAVLDFQGLMAKVLASGNVCRFNLTDTAIPANPGNPQKFIDALPAAISLARLHSSTVGSPPPVLASVGSPFNQTMSVQSISIDNISKIAPKQYTAQLQVNFLGGVRPIRPAAVSIVLQTDGGVATPGQETVTDCTLSTTPPSSTLIFQRRMLDGETVGGAGSTVNIFSGTYAGMNISQCIAQVAYSPVADADSFPVYTAGAESSFNPGAASGAYTATTPYVWGMRAAGGSHNSIANQFNWIFRAKRDSANNRFIVEAGIVVLVAWGNGGVINMPKKFRTFGDILIVCTQ